MIRQGMGDYLKWKSTEFLAMNSAYSIFQQQGRTKIALPMKTRSVPPTPRHQMSKLLTSGSVTGAGWVAADPTRKVSVSLGTVKSF